MREYGYSKDVIAFVCKYVQQEMDAKGFDNEATALIVPTGKMILVCKTVADAIDIAVAPACFAAPEPIKPKASG